MKHAYVAGARTAAPCPGSIADATSAAALGAAEFSGVRRALLACAATVAIYASGANAAKAASLDEVVARLNALEQSNHKLEQENAQLRKQVNSIVAAKDKKPKYQEASVGGGSARGQVGPAGQVYLGGPGPGEALPIIPGFLAKLPGDGLKFATPNGEIQLYGNLDLSLDGTTKGLDGKLDSNGAPPLGNMGWSPQIATNLSYFGIRGFQRMGDLPVHFVYQVETGFGLSATPGTRITTSIASDQVNGAISSRNSYVGFSSPDYGTIYAGKTDAPYKNSTDRMNPFKGMLGDYTVIMGNTGGDNRAEFMGRLDHSLWYESPDIHGFKLAALFSPGQNRSPTSDNVPDGESDCSGGDAPGDGGNPQNNCSDGGFNNAVSTSLSYEHGPLYLTAAYELHTAVNRSSDLYGNFATPSAALLAGDVANEWASKAAIQYKLPTKTTVSAIVEYMHRDLPSYLEFQDERTRFGTWLAIEQQLTEKDSVAFGWAHAFRTPGDPGQHNDSFYSTPGGAPGDMYGGTGVNNSSDMFTLAYKRLIIPGLTWYADAAGTFNGPAAHYNLGGNAHGITTDCHDASNGSSNAPGSAYDSNPHCWTGSTILGVSTGIRYQF